MSRSWKKTPITKDNGRGKKEWKRFANRKVRNTRELAEKGRGFKKCFCSYDIVDWKFANYSWEEVWKEIIESEKNMKYFYEKILGKPYTREKKTKKELQREFHKIIGK